MPQDFVVQKGGLGADKTVCLSNLCSSKVV